MRDISQAPSLSPLARTAPVRSPRYAEKSRAIAASPCRSAPHRIYRRSRSARRSAPSAIRDWHNGAAKCRASPESWDRGHRPVFSLLCPFPPASSSPAPPPMPPRCLRHSSRDALSPTDGRERCGSAQSRASLDAAPCQLLAELRQRRLATERFVDRVRGDGKAGAGDVFLCQIRQHGLELGGPLRVIA